MKSGKCYFIGIVEFLTFQSQYPDIVITFLKWRFCLILRNVVETIGKQIITEKIIKKTGTLMNGKLRENLFSKNLSLFYMQYNIWLLSHVCLTSLLYLIVSLSFPILFPNIPIIILFTILCCANL